MAKTTATMTEILSTIKLLNKKIETASSELANGRFKYRFYDVINNSDTMVNGKNIADLEKEFVANYDSVMSLLSNYRKLIAIKNSVNSRTKITLNGKTYTIAEALSMNVGSDYNRLITNFISHSKKIIDDINRHTKKYNEDTFSDENIGNWVTLTVGNIDKADPNYKDHVDKAIEKFKELRCVKYIHPEFPEKISFLEECHDNFNNNINFRLSECNSRIKVEYDLDKDGEELYTIINKEQLKEDGIICE